MDEINVGYERLAELQVFFTLLFLFALLNSCHELLLLLCSVPKSLQMWSIMPLH